MAKTTKRKLSAGKRGAKPARKPASKRTVKTASKRPPAAGKGVVKGKASKGKPAAAGKARSKAARLKAAGSKALKSKLAPKKKAAPRKVAAKAPAKSARRPAAARPAPKRPARRPARPVRTAVRPALAASAGPAPSAMPRTRFENPDHPPKNRLAEPLPVLHLEIVHAGGTAVMDPNRMLMAMLGDDWAGAFRPLPDLVSELSDETGGVLYRVEDVELRLTPEELRRLHLLALTPSEALYLLDRYGMAHDWHDDFYHPETGEAFQPKTEVPPDRPVPGRRPPG